MGSCLGLALIRGMEERVPKRKAVPRAIPEKPHYAPFLHDLVQDGRAARGRSSGAVEVVASLAVEVVGRRRASRAGAVVEVHSPIPPYVGTSSFCRAWRTFPGA